MAIIRLSSSYPVTETSVGVVVDQLELASSNYIRIEIFCSNGTSQRFTNATGSNAGGYFQSPIANFTGLSPGNSYSFRAEIQRFSSSTTENTNVINQSTLAPTVTVGTVTGLFAYSITATGFSITWDSASNASSYEVQLDNVTAKYVSSTSTQFTGLTTETYYSVRVRGYTGSTYGSYSSPLSVRTQSAIPSKLNWPTFYTSSGQGALTAKHWNDMTSKLNAWRVYKGYGTISFQVANNGNPLTATMFNQAVNTLNTMSPSYAAPSLVNNTTIGISARLNRLGLSIDSLT